MNAITTIEADEGAVSFVSDDLTPLSVIEDRTKAEGLFAKVRAEIDAHVPDLTTERGRKAIKSLAFKVTKTKTAVDDARKKLTEDARKQVDAANAAGRVIWDRLEDLAAEARKPLTEWEQAEKDRVAAVAAGMRSIEEAGVVSVDDTAETVAVRLAALKCLTFDAAVFGDSLERAQYQRDAAVAYLTGTEVRLRQEEADRAELARLRQESAARDEQDRLAREAVELKAKEEADAQAEKDRAAEVERLAQERAAQTIAKAEDDRKAEEQRLADEATARENDRAHRAKIMGSIKVAIMAAGGIDNDAATKIVLAIAKRTVPNIHIDF